ncbi:cysteine synthase family protein [bacterium]|nr:cysteine synthase family protein [bacterium]MBT4250860.1 cysteine synthase family protein [bacterium]MBT4597573.1 cysteine synthase family protein [bacterium]MBT6754038.1 cysteine synthase family protein [bacterium]MBT7038068.1 cysteine synthase family protein [bacterium]
MANRKPTDLTKLIGNTPLIQLDSFCTKKYNIYAKLEGENIGGSIKDRVALALITDLEKRKLLKKNKTIIEPSSGNTGIGLAMIAAKKGYAVRIVLPENATPERIAILKMFGTKVEFCKKEEWVGETAIKKIKELAKSDTSLVMPNQYENQICAQVHFETTGKEITKQIPNITHLVATVGTGGTISGIGKRMKSFNNQIQVVGVEVGSNSSIPGPRSLEGYIPPILDFTVIDQGFKIRNELEVHKIHKQLCTQEGLFYGISSAAALHGALEIAKKIEFSGNKKAHIVCVFPDRGEKYLSQFIK